MAKRYIIQIDSADRPGRLVVTTVRFDIEVLDPAEFDGSELEFLPMNLPEVRVLKRLLGGDKGGEG